MSSQIMTDIADKVAFSNYLSLMTRATADDNEPTPGYMLEEIEKITFLESPNSSRLVGYLLRRLGKHSNNVKLKVLKIMHHLVKKGHVSFRILLRRNDGHIKMSTLNRNPSGNLAGIKSYDAVVQAAKNLLQVLFDPDLLQKDDEGTQNEALPKLQLGALGSQGVQQGKYEGFGNSAIEKDTIKGKVMDYFEKLLNPTEELNEEIKVVLYSSPGNYQPPLLEDNQDTTEHVLTEALDLKKLKEHVPGRAGGGWETDDDEEQKHCEMALQKFNESAITSSSESIERLDIQSAKVNTAEAKFIESFCESNGLPILPSVLDKAMKQCSKLDGIKLLQHLHQLLMIHAQKLPEKQLYSENMDSISSKEKPDLENLMIALLFLEWFLQVGRVAPEISSAIMMPALVSLVDKSSALADVHAKSRKLKLILTRRKCV